jgi:hypothetical protein
MVSKSRSDCLLLQSDVGYIRSWCLTNAIKHNLSKTGVIYFIRKANVQNYQYGFVIFLTFRNCCINDSSVHIDCKVYFENLDFFTCHETAGVIRTFIFPFSTIHSLVLLWFALVRSELECASVTWEPN